MDKPLTIRRLARANLKSKPIRSFFLMILVLLFTLSLLAGTLFLRALAEGIERASDRLGADLIVVPSGYKANVEGILLKGEPSTFYLPSEAQKWMKDQPGIEKQTAQIYLATLSASCCSYPVQIIGIDPETDFLIRPWLEKNQRSSLGDDEVIVGANIEGIGRGKEKKVHFFNVDLNITGRLDRTGLGLDGTVFVNLKTAHKLAEASKRVGVRNAVNHEQVSVILLKVKPGIDARKVAADISHKYAQKGMFALSSRGFVSDLSSKLLLMTRIIGGILFAFWLLCLLVLALSFHAVIQERRKELATLRILGAKRSQLRSTVLWEALQLSIQGSAVGVVLGFLLTWILIPLLSKQMNFPLEVPDWATLLIALFGALGVGCIVGPLASLPAAIQVGRREAYTTMREAS